MIAGHGAARAVKAGALVIYTGLAVALFSGAWVTPTTSSLGLSGDAQQIIWFLGWPSFALAHGQNPLFTNYIDYPAGVIRNPASGKSVELRKFPPLIERIFVAGGLPEFAYERYMREKDSVRNEIASSFDSAPATLRTNGPHGSQ